MNFKIAGILILTTVTVAIGCDKKDPIRFEFQPDTDAYFNYKNFASWVYKPTSGGVNDTVISYDFASGMADRAEGLAAVSSNTLSGSKEAKVIVRAEAIPNQNLDRIAVLSLVNGRFEAGPVILNLNGVFNPEDSSVVTKLLTFDVAGKQYENIWEMTLKNHPVYKKLWFAKGVGIIKKIYLNNETYDLIEFNPGR